MTKRWTKGLAALALAGAAVGLAPGAQAQTVGSSAAQPAPATEATPGSDASLIALHAQTTFVYQGHDAFASPYRGDNSLSPAASARETWDATLYAGVRPWAGGELWVDPEIDQGFGLSDTLGVAGFPSGEAYKVGKAQPYFRLQRAFFRQTVDLGGETETVEADLNQFAGARTADRLTLTVGKFSVGDLFDTNKYAHDPRADFLNWTIIDAGTFDYAADAWGYSAGAAAEWRQGWWTLRGGAFLLSDVPNSERLDTRFHQFELVGEIEARHALFGRAGTVKLTGYLNRGRMGRLDEAAALARATGQPADASLVRRYAGRPGLSVDVEQPLSDDVGAFLRAGVSHGAYEAYEFTDVDRSLSGGVSIAGKRWGRADDTVGLAGVVNAASGARQRYLDAGGLGILVGDGRLPHPGTETIVEAYYDATAIKGVHVALDVQRIANPAYNRDRGPASVLAVRLHAQL